MEHVLRIEIRRISRERAAGESTLERLIGFEDGAIGLDAKRVDGKDGGLPPVVERAEEDLDVVVAADAVAIGERRPRRSVRLELADGEMNWRGSGPNLDLGGILGGHPL